MSSTARYIELETSILPPDELDMSSICLDGLDMELDTSIWSSIPRLLDMELDGSIWSSTAR